MEGQTVRPEVVVVDDPPLSTGKDIARRFKLGLERTDGDVVFIIEDDDYYDPTYCERMLEAWERAGKPDLFGIGYSIYYHVGVRRWNRMEHQERASAYCTMLTAEAKKFISLNDNEVFVDLSIWKSVPRRATWSPDRPIAVGIKGASSGALTGGIGHNPRWGGYNANDDKDGAWLESMTGKEAKDFYYETVGIV